VGVDGRITDRTRDRLGASDLAIVEFRRIMVEAVRRFLPARRDRRGRADRGSGDLRVRRRDPEDRDLAYARRVAGTKAG